MKPSLATATGSSAILLSGRFGQCFNCGNVLDKVVWQVMPFLQVVWTIVRKPTLAVGIFPHQNLQWEIDRKSGSSQHQRRSRLRIAKDQELGWRHFHTDLFCFAAVVYQRKQSYVLGAKNACEPLHCFVHSVIGWAADQAIDSVYGCLLCRCFA